MPLLSLVHHPPFYQDTEALQRPGHMGVLHRCSAPDQLVSDHKKDLEGKKRRGLGVTQRPPHSSQLQTLSLILPSVLRFTPGAGRWKPGLLMASVPGHTL